MDLLTGRQGARVPVGRLDYHSEGLLLLTNDGEFANRLTAPAPVHKTYVVKVTGEITPAQENSSARACSCTAAKQRRRRSSC